MLNKIITLVVMLGVCAGLSVAAFRYDNANLQRALYSAIALTVLYFVFKFMIEETVAGRISEPAARYSFRRVMSVLVIIGALIALSNIWTDAQNLLVTYGLVGAGVALALQDLFKNLAGGLILFIRGSYRVGDRIEIDAKKGDVIDIGLMNTTLMEIGEWVSGDQPTGRLCLLPNGRILSNAVHNYTRDHEFIWDEINIPITYGSDWRLVSATIQKLVASETVPVNEQAKASLARLSGRYYLQERSEAPRVFVTATDNWINLSVRYVSEVRERRETKDRLSRKILEAIETLGQDKARISSQTLSVTVEPAGQS